MSSIVEIFRDRDDIGDYRQRTVDAFQKLVFPLMAPASPRWRQAGMNEE